MVIMEVALGAVRNPRTMPKKAFRFKYFDHA